MVLPGLLTGRDGKNDSSYWALLTTIVALAALARSVLPPGVLRFIRRQSTKILAYFDPYSTYTIHEFAGTSPDQNYERVKTYLSGRGVSGARRVQISQPKNAGSPVFALADNEAFIDAHEGVQYHWVHFVNQRSGTIVAVDSSVAEEIRSFQLKVLAKHQHTVQKYINHIIKRAAELEQLNRELLIYNFSPFGGGGWRGGKGRLWDSQPFKHPATFDTLALDHSLKSQVMQRLDAFKTNEGFYSRTGRAHKMGFFLFGPPGCGKTSFIAAVANHMHYDVYDVDLVTVGSNLSLRGALTQIGDKAVVVIEDIDTVELPDRRSVPATPPEGRMERPKRRGDDEAGAASTLTLGGVLNFADGLRSSSGSERIFIFTTNHPERLDPALIRPGRMDLHIQLTHCSMDGFRDLCRTYLGIREHALFPEIERLLEGGARITPAQLAGALEAHADDADTALQHLIRRLVEPAQS